MSNKLTVDFKVKNSDWIHNFDNEIQVAVIEGNTDDIIELCRMKGYKVNTQTIVGDLTTLEISW